MVSSRRSLALVSVIWALASCDDPPRTASWPVISDAVHNSGTEGFYWLPPLVPHPTVRGVFEPQAEPTLVIEERGGANRRWTFSATVGVGGETLTLNGEHYQANWHSRDFGLDPTLTYRLRVLVPGGRELGFADVDVVSSGSQLRNVNSQEYVALQDGRTLPVKFRVEHAAVDRDGGGPLDWRDNCPTVANADQRDTDGDGVGDARECPGVTCAAQDVCHTQGVCDPTTGACSNPEAAEGALCDDGDVSTPVDRCSAGACQGVLASQPLGSVEFAPDDAVASRAVDVGDLSFVALGPGGMARDGSPCSTCPTPRRPRSSPA